MTAEEAHRADLWATGVRPCIPIEFVRDRLEAGLRHCAEVLETVGPSPG
jgi:hypothetical protein